MRDMGNDLNVIKQNMEVLADEERASREKKKKSRILMGRERGKHRVNEKQNQ